MRRMVVFSDLHGNHQALQAMLERESGTVVSVGDVLGRAGSNQACLEQMRERGVTSVQGNHELRMLTGYRPSLEEWAVTWVRRWPLELIDEEALVTHTLIELNPGGADFFNIDLPEQAQVLLRRRPLVFTGHLHRPGYWRWDEQSAPLWRTVCQPCTIELERGWRYLFQVGSLGEPEAAHVPRYLVWTPGQVEWRGL